MSQVFSNPKARDEADTLEATFGTRSTVGAGLATRTIIDSAYVRENLLPGTFVRTVDTNALWMATPDPLAPNPNDLVLVLISSGGGSSLPDLLVVVGESPKYGLSSAQRTTIFGGAGGVALAVSLGGATVLVLPGSYDHTGLGPQTVPTGVDLVGMDETPEAVQITGALNFEGVSGISNATVNNPSVTDAYTAKVTGAALATFSATNVVFNSPGAPGAGVFSPSFLFDGTNAGSAIELTRVQASKVPDGDADRTAIEIQTRLAALTMRSVVIDDQDDATRHTGVSLRVESNQLDDTISIDADCLLRGRMEVRASTTQFAGELRTYLDTNAAVPVRLASAGTLTTRVRLYVSPAARIRHNSPNAVFEGTNNHPVENIIISWTTLAIRSDVAPANILGNYCRPPYTAAEGRVSQIQSGVTLLVDSDGALPPTIPSEVDVFIIGTGVTVSPNIDIFNGARTAVGRAVEVVNFGPLTLNLLIGTGAGSFNQGAGSSLAIPSGTSVRLRWTDDGLNPTWVVVATAGVAGGQQIKYIVAPAWLALSGSYLTATGPTGAIAAAIADGVSAAQPANVFYMPGTYAEDFTIATGTPLRAGLNLLGFNQNRGGNILNLASTGIEFNAALGGDVSFANFELVKGGGGSALSYITAAGFFVQMRNVGIASSDAAAPTIIAPAGATGSLTLDAACTIDNSAAGGAIDFDASGVTLNSHDRCFLRTVTAGATDFTVRVSTTAGAELRDTSVQGRLIVQSASNVRDVLVSIGPGVAAAVTLANTPTVQVRNLRVDAGGGAAIDGTGTLNVVQGNLAVDGSVASTVTTNITGPAGRCRYIQRIAAVAAIPYAVNYGVDAVWVDAQIAGATVDLNAANTLPDGWELEVLSAPSTATYTAATTFSFTLAAPGAGINNVASKVVAHEDSFVLRADKTENRYRWAP